MKKMILAAVLVLAIGLSACGPGAGSTQQPAAESPTETPSTVPSIPQETQIQILEANRSSWEFREPYESPWFYTFTDLDLN
jgi:hypothetical protein